MAKRLANKSRRNLIKNTEIGRRKFESNLDRIAEYQNKIQDEYYISYAVDKIAAEITHFLLK